MGHFVYPHPLPVTEKQKHSAYPGCYALSKVLEEVMVEQYGIQYDLNVCCLRAPWIMEKDDFKYQLSFGEDVFGVIAPGDAGGIVARRVQDAVAALPPVGPIQVSISAAVVHHPVDGGTGADLTAAAYAAIERARAAGPGALEGLRHPG